MKTALLIARILLGLIFLTFGLNGFLHFIPAPPPTGVPLQFVMAMLASRYWMVIFGVQAICGALLLVNRFVPLALVALAAEIVNILAFHIFMGAPGLPLAFGVAVLWAFVAWGNRQHLAGIFVART
jgi:putative oxidoreductase